MSIESNMTSHGSLFIKDEDLKVPLVGQHNPLAIYNEEGVIGLVITPQGEVLVHNQDVITKWAKETTEMMTKLNAPVQDHEFISDSDPGDEA